jgi:hypothetical protein
MTHFAVLVIGPSNRDELTVALGPFSENVEVEPWVETDGTVTTYNPRSQWDWWVVGGRWSGEVLPLDRADRLGDHEPCITYAVLTPDGEWYQRCDEHWNDPAQDEKDAEEWRAQFAALVASPADLPAYVVDCHI